MEGGCHCGAIRFRVTKDPTWVGACYCIDCRKISGTPYTVFAGYPIEAVEITKGIPKEYASSAKVIRSFCEKCSSPIAWVHKEIPKTFISVGVFDDPSGFKMQSHIWVSQKLPWVAIHDDLPQSAE